MKGVDAIRTAPEPMLRQVWAALCTRLPRLEAYAGPTEVARAEILGELKALGIGPTDGVAKLLGACTYSVALERGKVKTTCFLKVGDGLFDWVSGSGPDRHKALCLAALRALEWFDMHHKEAEHGMAHSQSER